MIGATNEGRMGARRKDGWFTVKAGLYEYRIGGMAVAFIQRIKSKKRFKGKWGVTYNSLIKDILFSSDSLDHCKNCVEYDLRSAVYETDFAKYRKEEDN